MSLSSIDRAFLCALLAFGTMGCGGSPTTLAVETPPKSDSAEKAPPAAIANETPSATEKTEATPNTAFKTVEEPTPSSTPTDPLPATALQPKLTMVDPQEVIGRWRDSFFGTRTLTLNADGTARMELDLDFAGRLLYGKRLDFDMKWTLEGGTITIDVIEGTPAEQAKSAMATWGSRYMYLLDNIETQQIEMRDWDGSMSYTLRRLPDEKPSDSK